MLAERCEIRCWAAKDGCGWIMCGEMFMIEAERRARSEKPSCAPSLPNLAKDIVQIWQHVVLILRVVLLVRI